ncbi:DUF1761 family protein [Nocardia cyriacigeorgica]|uniref:DUF1761 domain-containing protein n=1 Tax=Nocardia cyriacigeorgica (strain GUH-2) TaxID=1127134 RepID=H6R9C9_NOCCG|nr:DUF1761 family protein [Nocardia cyriacigeorgica]CCF64910.1 membrane protein of unknown function [Nocardia cyriacigeorgica GUH-2]
MVVVGVVAAAIVSFVISAVLYATPPVAALVSRTSTPRPGVGVPVQMLFVLLRGLLAATVLALLLVAGDRHGVAAGAVLGAIVAILPVTILAGAVVHENVPIPTALVHMTDWVLKLVISGVVLGLFI